ncbi:SDR family NAD(P)-dependent oxidoreductase [Aquamicrobium ahrensii]|uniref:3-oxoacyl-[acyl-carrier protein] reductase n=1 Tax=Aquamicrobium ahrensii TaxID=469551 RepID=A0ABV2KPG0_9HYPH
MIEDTDLALSGKCAIVTGAARNIGRETALALAKAGADVVVHANRSREDAEKVVEEIRHMGRGAILHLGDLTCPDAGRDLVAAALAAFGRVDILVNNAAVRREESLAAISYDAWRLVLASILDAGFLSAQAAAGVMESGGRIINIGGMTAHTGAPERAHVVTAKAGLIGLTKALARELAPRGITVNIVVPGRINTDRKAAGLSEPVHHATGSLPLGFEGEPSDVASMVAYLAGPQGRYLTGQTIHVNGGLYLP